MRLGSLIAMDATPLAAVRSLASRFPTPTNAQAAAALDSFSQSDAASMIRGGMPTTLAESFLLPDGVFPRMRLLAWGWTKPGDKFKSPVDKQWWSKVYQYPLWAPIETYIEQATQAGMEPPALLWDEEMASGDPAELSRSLPIVIQSDLPPVNEAPCPKYIVPPRRGMLPILNPSCIKPPTTPIRVPAASKSDWSWLLILVLVYAISKDRK